MWQNSWIISHIKKRCADLEHCPPQCKVVNKIFDSLLNAPVSEFDFAQFVGAHHAAPRRLIFARNFGQPGRAQGATIRHFWLVDGGVLFFLVVWRLFPFNVDFISSNPVFLPNFFDKFDFEKFLNWKKRLVCPTVPAHVDVVNALTVVDFVHFALTELEDVFCQSRVREKTRFDRNRKFWQGWDCN